MWLNIGKDDILPNLQFTFGNTIEPMSYLGFWGLGLLMSLQGSFIWCNGITSATSTFYHAHSQFPFRHINAMLGSPGGSSML